MALPEFFAISLISSAPIPFSLWATSKTLSKALADLRPKLSASASENNRLPFSSTMQIAHSRAVMFRRLTLLPTKLPDSHTFFSKPLSVRTITCPPHSGTSIVSVGKSLAPRIVFCLTFHILSKIVLACIRIDRRSGQLDS